MPTMIGCPACAKSIPVGSAFCPHCGVAVAGAAVAANAAPPKRSRLATLLGLAVGLAFVGMCAAAISNSPDAERARLDRAIAANPVLANAPDTSPAAQATAPKLLLLSKRGYESDSGGYYYVEGQVKNTTDRPMRNVAVVATWYTKDGTFITTDQSLIDYNPLLPGQVSPFKSITRGNPQMSKFQVEFKELTGGTIAHEEAAKR
jgi:hypothetical protein